MKKPIQMLVALVAMSMALWVAVDSTSEADALSNGVGFGAFVKPVNGQTNITAIQNLERQLGAELPVIRAFSNWDDNIGADHNLHRWVKDNDRDLLVSIKAQRDNGAVIKWRDIANAQPGSTLYKDMQRLASGVRRHGDSMTVIFHHEPEAGTNSAYGNNEDFKAAFRKLHNVFEAEGANNAQFAWVMTNWAFAVGDIRPDDPRVADRWYPGDDVVDFIGADPYNWNNCRNSTTEPWRSLEEIIEPFVRWADRKPNKPLILAEFGSDDAGGTRKAEWIDDARSLFKSGKHKDRFAAVIYFSSDHAAAGHPGCDWFLNSSSNTLDASKRFAQDSFFHTSLSRSATAQAPAPAPVPAAPPASQSGDVLRCGGRVVTIVGTSGADRIIGTNRADVIHGLGGNDTILGADGDDIICGGGGDDAIVGGAGSDELYGDDGADFLKGSNGPDTLYGGQGVDRLNGGHGADTLRGNSGDDRLFGGRHKDVLVGGDATDTCNGGAGVDQLNCESSRN